MVVDVVVEVAAFEFEIDQSCVNDWFPGQS